MTRTITLLGLGLCTAMLLGCRRERVVYQEVYHEPVVVEERPVIIERRPVVVERRAPVVVHETYRPVERKRPARAYQHRSPDRHVHSSTCGCVYDRGRWVQIRGGHVHKPGCGHVYANGRWVVRR